jgi:hypothetical protein
MNKLSLVLFSFLILVFVSSSANATSYAWWNYTWHYRAEINLTSTSGTAPNGTEVNVSLTSALLPNFQWSNSCNDIRVIDPRTNSLVPFWNENCNTVGKTANIWIKSNRLLNSTPIVLLMYYNASGMSSISSGVKTFETFDDFNAASLNTSYWTLGNSSCAAAPHMAAGFLNFTGISCSGADYWHSNSWVIHANAGLTTQKYMLSARSRNYGGSAMETYAAFYWPGTGNGFSTSVIPAYVEGLIFEGGDWTHGRDGATASSTTLSNASNDKSTNVQAFWKQGGNRAQMRAGGSTYSPGSLASESGSFSIRLQTSLHSKTGATGALLDGSYDYVILKLWGYNSSSSFKDQGTVPLAFVTPTASNGYYNRTSLVVNITDDTSFNKTSVYLYNKTGLRIKKVFNSSNVLYNFTGLANGRYYINATANTTNIIYHSTTLFYILDSRKPSVVFSNLVNNSHYTFNLLNFNISMNENVSSCTIYMTGATKSNTTLTVTNNGVSTIAGSSILLNNGVTTTYAYCTDMAGFVNRSKTYTITETLNPQMKFINPTPYTGRFYSRANINISFTTTNISRINFTYTNDTKSDNFTFRYSNLVTSINFNDFVVHNRTTEYYPNYGAGAFFKMDEASGGITDLTNNGVNCNASGANLSYSQAGQFNKSIRFSAGANTMFKCTRKTSVYLKKTGTLSGWAKLFATTGSFDLFGWHGTARPHWDDGYFISISGSTVYNVIDNETVADQQISCTGTVPSAGVWHNYVLTWDGTRITCYIDGVLTGNLSQTFNAMPDANGFTIGSDLVRTTYATSGFIDEVYVSKAPITAREAKAMYQESVYYDKGILAKNYSANFITGTIKGVHATGYNSTIHQLPYLKTSWNAAFSSPNGTICMQMKYGSTSHAGSEYLWWYGSDSSTASYISSYDDAAGIIHIVLQNNTAVLNHVFVGNYKIADTKWHQVCWSSYAGAYKIYIDGVSMAINVTTGSNNGLWTNRLVSPTNNVFGGWSWQYQSAGHANLSMDDIMVFNKSLKDQDMVRSFNTSFAKSGTTGYLTFYENNLKNKINYTYTSTAIDYAGNLNTSSRWMQSGTPTVSVNLYAPTSSHSNILSGNVFSCNVIALNALANLSLYVWNSTNNRIFAYTKTVSGTVNSSSWNVNFSATGLYNWNCKAFDSSTNQFAYLNKTLNIDTVPPVVSFVSPTRSNNTFINKTIISVNVSVNENVSSCTLSWFGGSGSVSMSTHQGGINTWAKGNITSVAGVVKYDVKCSDISGNNNVPKNMTLTIDTTPPSVTYLYTTPNDLDVFNIFGNGRYSITYNVTDNYNVNKTTVRTYIKTNSSVNDCTFSVNGTNTCGYMANLHSNMTTNSSSGKYRFVYDDNDIYPAVYNAPEETVEQTPHKIFNLTSTSSYAKVELLNISSIKRYGIYEVMLKNYSGNGAASIYVCNQSYSSSPMPQSNCVLLSTLATSVPYNHTHSIYSSHQVFIMPINVTNGAVAGVKITQRMYFVIFGADNTTWQIRSVPIKSRSSSAFGLSSDNASTFTYQTTTADSHMHEYYGTEKNYRKLFVCDNAGNCVNSTATYGSIALRGVPPTSVDVLSPRNKTYYGTSLDINYTKAFSYDNYSIANYSIYLLNNDFSMNETLIINNGLNLNYTTNLSAFARGSFIIDVKACDVFDQCSDGYSSVFEHISAFKLISFIRTMPPIGCSYNHGCKSPGCFACQYPYFNATRYQDYNVTPFGQNSSLPFWAIINNGTGAINLSIALNQTSYPGVKFKVSTSNAGNYRRSCGVTSLPTTDCMYVMNTSPHLLAAGVAPNATVNVWIMTDFIGIPGGVSVNRNMSFTSVLYNKTG